MSVQLAYVIHENSDRRNHRVIDVILQFYLDGNVSKGRLLERKLYPTRVFSATYVLQQGAPGEHAAVVNMTVLPLDVRYINYLHKLYSIESLGRRKTVHVGLYLIEVTP